MAIHSAFLLYRRAQQVVYANDKWFVKQKITGTQSNKVPLGCFSHHPQLALVERIWCICLAVENRKMSLCCKLSYSAQLLHLLNSACVCSYQRCCNTETAVKETACAGKPVLLEWILTSWAFKCDASEHAYADLTKHRNLVVRRLWGNDCNLGRECSGRISRKDHAPSSFGP